MFLKFFKLITTKAMKFNVWWIKNKFQILFISRIEVKSASNGKSRPSTFIYLTPLNFYVLITIVSRSDRVSFRRSVSCEWWWWRICIRVVGVIAIMSLQQTVIHIHVFLLFDHCEVVKRKHDSVRRLPSTFGNRLSISFMTVWSRARERS